ncbi:UDP-N-acetyl-D-mannosaminuronic acid dehydrogenase [Erythrobacter litoralis HTCC2594]|uniref:UDP-N-acetyl-D-mannosaminuronic acid dehydrogenase n=2 Tax=Erythrobacter litoralis TaxID=39960 RepID=Q2N6E4_ERYLH|nr:UDP-N-acetyl-D-mannosaminuronic acid dehydrogenase [Erythrobacter litoralis HTCC2594]
MARAGCSVTGVDISEEVVVTINRGAIHIEEVDLDGLVKGVVSRGALRASTHIVPADVFVIAVPTPFAKDGKHTPDTSHVMAAATDIAAVLKKGDSIILESTCPVGTTHAMRDLLAGLRPDLSMPGLSDGIADIAISYCPERVLPGRIIEELVHNDRSIGGITPRCARKAISLYKHFVKGDCIATDAKSAEMTKLVENAYRDVNIAFANELSMIAAAMKLDVWEVIRLANRHPRVDILEPGPGVGGHCIAVDPWFIVHGAPEEAVLIRTGREVNDRKMHHVTERAAQLIEAHPDKRVACLGLSFKANVDDFRESPARYVAARLAERFGDRLSIVEPYANMLPAEFDGTGATLVDLDSAIEQSEIMIVLVNHDLFKAVPFDERVDKIVYDLRGIWPGHGAPDQEAIGVPAKLLRTGT